MISRSVNPALAHRVMAVALTEWLVYVRERPASALISFINEDNLFFPSGRFSYHTFSEGRGNFSSDTEIVHRIVDSAL